MRKIFASLAGALALIIVPPSGEAERQDPIVLDLSAPAPTVVASGAPIEPAPRVAPVWRMM